MWTTKSIVAFLQLKEADTTPIVLILLDFTKVFNIKCGASGVVIWVVLMQDYRPVAFYRKALKGKALHYFTYEKELLALVSIVKKCRPYLLGKPSRSKPITRVWNFYSSKRLELQLSKNGLLNCWGMTLPFHIRWIGIMLWLMLSQGKLRTCWFLYRKANSCFLLFLI